MTERSAHAIIKGYFYQFDQTMVRILESSSPSANVVVEGIEDIDLCDGDQSAYVQCKYYEGTEYNHSIIKDAVIEMLKHFHLSGCSINLKAKYRIFGHYKSGQQKLQENFDLNFLKKHFLTYEHKKKSHEVHRELGVNDTQLTHFRSLLDININAPSYEEQQKTIIKLLSTQIPGSSTEDIELFHYPNAINVIQTLAIEPDITKRKITKTVFMSSVNKKEIVFSLWLRKKFGDNYLAKAIKRKHFKSLSTKTPKASRIFCIDMAGEFDLQKSVDLLMRIGNSFSHKEHNRTPQQDRFCAYVLLRGITPLECASLKSSLWKQGLKFSDGYPFYGADFFPSHLACEPTKENLIKLKFIPDKNQIAPVISAISGSAAEVFDFYKIESIETELIPKHIPHHTFKVESAFFIQEIISS